MTAKTQVQCRLSFPACIAVKLRQGILCGEAGHITGLSLLLYIEHQYNRSFHDEDWEAMALQMCEGSKKLSHEYSKSLTKEKEFLVHPTEIHQLQQGLLTYGQLLQLVFGPDAYIATQVKMWHDHILSNHSHYADLSSSKKTLPTQIGMSIQAAVTAFLSDCRLQKDLAEVNMAYLDFSTRHQSIMTMEFNYHLTNDIKVKFTAATSPATPTPTVGQTCPAPSPPSTISPQPSLSYATFGVPKVHLCNL